MCDWISGVCSSDLLERGFVRFARLGEALLRAFEKALLRLAEQLVGDLGELRRHDVLRLLQLCQPRLEGARVGLERRKLGARSEEHPSELQSLMRISYAVSRLKKKIQKTQ